MERRNIIVLGGGLAGLSAAIRLCEKGCHVKLVSLLAVRRSHSVCAQGGINAAMNQADDGDSPEIHACETIIGGDFLANQPPVVEMCMAGPSILRMMDQFGCLFNRLSDGSIDFRRFGGSLYSRTAFCNSSTGQQLLYSLDEQVRRYEAKGMVEKFEHHEFLRLVLDGTHRACGIVMHDLRDLKLHALPADAVIVATGGCGMIYKKSTNATICTGAANGRLYMQGMKYANPEFIQIHPTAIPGKDKMRLISESVRAEGGRIWVNGDSSKQIRFPDGSVRPCGKTGMPWYFLEEMYPVYGNLVPRDIGAREIVRVCEMGLGVDSQMQVYLDASHLPPDRWRKISSVLDIYRKFTGGDPLRVPMKVFPAVHYSMGGAWVDWPASDDPDRWSRFRHMTNISGCFNAGESDYQYHGANRLGANALLACIFGGLIAGEEAARYADGVLPSVKEAVFDAAMAEERQTQKRLLNSDGPENVFQLHEELSDAMIRHTMVKRDNLHLQELVGHIQKLRERYQRISLDDRSSFANQTYVFARQFPAMLEIALAIVKGALLRNESRGSHFKEEFATRNDSQWLKTTIASYRVDEPAIDYEPVDLRHLDPSTRDYTVGNRRLLNKLALTRVRQM
jgi:succinate dehydrogenase / fumarate reductase flavoprotein subunit